MTFKNRRLNLHFVRRGLNLNSIWNELTFAMLTSRGVRGGRVKFNFKFKICFVSRARTTSGNNVAVIHTRTTALSSCGCVALVSVVLLGSWFFLFPGRNVTFALITGFKFKLTLKSDFKFKSYRLRAWVGFRSEFHFLKKYCKSLILNC